MSRKEKLIREVCENTDPTIAGLSSMVITMLGMMTDSQLTELRKAQERSEQAAGNVLAHDLAVLAAA